MPALREISVGPKRVRNVGSSVFTKFLGQFPGSLYTSARSRGDRLDLTRCRHGRPQRTAEVQQQVHDEFLLQACNTGTRNLLGEWEIAVAARPKSRTENTVGDVVSTL